MNPTVCYLDCNATTPLAPGVVAAMQPFLERHFGNASSVHAAGRAARAAIDDARRQLATILGARPAEIVFTSGGTESDNLAVIGLARQFAARGRHVITCATEHHAVLNACDHLERHEGFRVTRLPVDGRGVVDLAALAAALEEPACLVSIMAANNETGVLQPVAEIAALCRARSVIFHCDTIQWFGREPLDVRQAGPDAVSLSAHKFGGPKGAGLLWLREGVQIQGVMFGGAQEAGRRPGTENVAAIVGMAAAAQHAVAGLEAERSRQTALRDQLWHGVRNAFPNAVLNGEGAPRLANTLNVSLPGCDSQNLLINLDLEGVCASAGSACMTGSVQVSHVLLAMGLPMELARAGVRFSLGRQTTAAEIERVIDILPRIANRMRSVVFA